MDASKMTPEVAAKQDVAVAEQLVANARTETEHVDACHELMDANNRLALIQGRPGRLDPSQLYRDGEPFLETDVPDATNPKDLIGVKKTALHLVPSTSIIQQARAMENGAAKYGSFNWREKEVRASIYVSACMRHLYAWLDGEEAAKDSGVHHLGHALACLGILLDAQCMNKLVDDRSAGPASVLLDYFDESKKS